LVKLKMVAAKAARHLIAVKWREAETEVLLIQMLLHIVQLKVIGTVVTICFTSLSFRVRELCRNKMEKKVKCAIEDILNTVYVNYSFTNVKFYLKEVNI
jgi:hypothetical protein